MNSFKRRLKATGIMLGVISGIFLFYWFLAKYTLEFAIGIFSVILIFGLYHLWKSIYEELT